MIVHFSLLRDCLPVRYVVIMARSHAFSRNFAVGGFKDVVFNPNVSLTGMWLEMKESQLSKYFFFSIFNVEGGFALF